VIELAKRQSPSGELFDVSAVAVKKLEHLAFTLGAMVDIVRALTVRPLTTRQRVLVVAALKSLDALDPWARALDQTLARLQKFAAEIEETNRGGTTNGTR
jgi:hypothetical protein